MIIFNTSGSTLETQVYQSYYSVFHNSLPVDTNISNSTQLSELCENELYEYLTKYTSQQIYDLHQASSQLLWDSRIEFAGNDT